MDVAARNHETSRLLQLVRDSPTVLSTRKAQVVIGTVVKPEAQLGMLH